MNITTLTPPAGEPVTIPELLAHCRISHNDDNAYLGGLLTAAREYVESATGVAMLPTTFEQSLDAFPGDAPIPLLRSPLISLTSVAYVDERGEAKTMDVDATVVDARSRPPRIGLGGEAGACWPTARDGRINAVTVTFVAGHADAAAVPAMLKAAIKLLVAHWYELRTPVITGTIVSDVPMSVDSLISLNRVRSYR